MINGISKDQLIEKVLLLADKIQSVSLSKSDSSSFKTRLKVMFTFPESKTFLIKMMDVAFRPKNKASVANVVQKIINQSKSASLALFSGTEKILVNIFVRIGYKFPGISIPIMLAKIREDAQNVVFLKGSEAFKAHIQKRKLNGIQSNVNLIGESLLGEEEARNRIDQYKKLLHESDVDYISIKISTISSQINVLAFDETVSKLSERLAELYDEILLIEKQTGITKFINLDMEEYRDMSMTVAVFTKTLSLPRFKGLKAGIVLQAYIPDSYQWLLKLQAWAHERVLLGGAPIKIRVVKGANLEMEKTESALQGWPLVTFDKKLHTDANYKRMILQLLEKSSCKSVKIGIASHNVFDIAFAIIVVKELGLQESVDFEMLEGMANSLVDFLKKEGMNVLLYTPVVKPKQYISAIAYLVRRLDEGTADGNFLKEGFELQPDTAKWNSMKTVFAESVDLIYKLSELPRRKQNRFNEKVEDAKAGFENEPDTDWILPANREWLANIKAKWENNPGVLHDVIRLSGLISRVRETVELTCWQGELPWKYELAGEADYSEALEKGNRSSWFALSHKERIDIIRKAALEIKKQRADLMGVAATELGKLVSETDPEISEAIDFANFYAQIMENMLHHEEIELISGKVNLVLPPWNFPIAIPAGGVLASLVTGNSVILKPSENAIACSFVLCECLWKAGVPKDALFFLPAKEEVLSPFLKDSAIFGAVILTGGTETAKFLLKQTPALPLFAETGGKNATIVTALSDREQAIAHVIHSAFGNVGQKCSATSLMILEKEVFEDEDFKSLLKDAVESLKVGSPWDFSSKIGPMSVLPNEKIHKVISDKKNWLVPPKLDGWYLSPCVKWGVKKGDFEYENELFAPILSVMCAENLVKAVELANGTNYGLTSGLESLDEDEIKYWKHNIQAGNLYINRPTTGAIVQRQPFGGLKQSCFGFGMKAGGVNYLTQFVKVKKSASYTSKSFDTSKWNEFEGLSEEDKYDLAYAEKDYAVSFKTLFADPYEEVKIRGQYNTKRYLIPEKVILCVDDSTDFKSILMVSEACKQMKCTLLVCKIGDRHIPRRLISSPYHVEYVASWDELDTQFQYNICLRVLTKLPDSFRNAATEKGVHLYENEVLPFGRYEFLNYLTEQSISHNYHRYGNLMGHQDLNQQ